MLDASQFRRLGDALGGVIFLCTDSTYASCVTQGLFGLPRSHSSYVQHIKPGMLLFLFNTSTRRLHGIFEAVSEGGLDINPAAWPIDGSRRSSRYPAQVKVKIVDACPPLAEKLFQPLIEDSYVDNVEFQLELSQAEAAAIAALMRHECGLEMGFTSGFDTRGLDPKELGGVIFSCTKGTMGECMVSRLFGLPRQHYGYVRHICRGMPIFLFHAGTRMLHGPFAAAGPGGWNMEPKAFSPPPAKDGGSRFPAQVRVESTSQAFCIPEATFKPAIQAAYFSLKEFHFELTHSESAELAQLLRKAAAEVATNHAAAAPAHQQVSSNGPRSTAPQSHTSQTSRQPQEAHCSGDQSEAGGKGRATAAVNGVNGAALEASKVAGAEQRKLERAARRAARAAAKSGGSAGAPLQQAGHQVQNSSAAPGLTTSAAVAAAAAPHVIDLEAPDPKTLGLCHAQAVDVPHAAAAAASDRSKGSHAADLASCTSLRSKLDAIFAEAAQPVPALPLPDPPGPVGSSLPIAGPPALPSGAEAPRPLAQAGGKIERFKQPRADSPAVNRPKSAREIVAEQAQAAAGDDGAWQPANPQPQTDHPPGALRQNQRQTSLWSPQQQDPAPPPQPNCSPSPPAALLVGSDSSTAVSLQLHAKQGQPAGGSMTQQSTPEWAPAGSTPGNAGAVAGPSRSSARDGTVEPFSSGLVQLPAAPAVSSGVAGSLPHPACHLPAQGPHTSSNVFASAAVNLAQPQHLQQQQQQQPGSAVPLQPFIPSAVTGLGSSVGLDGQPTTARLQMPHPTDEGGKGSPNRHQDQASLDLLQELEGMLEGRLNAGPQSPALMPAAKADHGTTRLAAATTTVPASTALHVESKGNYLQQVQPTDLVAGMAVPASKQPKAEFGLTAGHLPPHHNAGSLLGVGAQPEQPSAPPGSPPLSDPASAAVADAIIDLTSDGPTTAPAPQDISIAPEHGAGGVGAQHPELLALHTQALSGPQPVASSHQAPSNEGCAPGATHTDRHAAAGLPAMSQQDDRPGKAASVDVQNAPAEAPHAETGQHSGMPVAAQAEALQGGQLAVQAPSEPNAHAAAADARARSMVAWPANGAGLSSEPPASQPQPHTQPDIANMLRMGARPASARAKPGSNGRARRILRRKLASGGPRQRASPQGARRHGSAKGFAPTAPPPQDPDIDQAAARRGLMRGQAAPVLGLGQHLQTQRSPGSRRLMITLSSDEDDLSPPAKRQRMSQNHAAPANRTNGLQPRRNGTPGNGLEGGLQPPSHPQPLRPIYQQQEGHADLRGLDPNLHLGSSPAGQPWHAAEMEHAGIHLSATQPRSLRSRQPVQALTAAGQGHSTPHLAGMLPKPRSHRASAAEQAATGRRGQHGSPEEDEADSPELAQPSHPAACLPQGPGQDAASMGVLGMGNQAADWVQQEAQYLHPRDLLAAAKQLQGLADEYTGELAAVQRAMGHVLALLSGPGLLASSTSPAQPIPPLQPPHASTVQGGSAKTPSSHGAKRQKTEVSGQGLQRQQKLRRLDKPGQSPGDVDSQLHGCKPSACRGPPMTGQKLTGAPAVPFQSRTAPQPGPAPLDLETDAHGLLEPTQQQVAEQLPGMVRACLQDADHHTSRADDLQHASGTELAHALHLELSHAAQTEANGNGVPIPHAGDGLALDGNHPCHCPEGCNGGHATSNGLAGIGQPHSCQAGGSDREQLAAQDLSLQADLPLRPGSPGIVGELPAASEGLAAGGVISAVEAALENEVDRRMSEEGSGLKAKSGKKSKKQAKLGLPPQNLKKDKQQRKRERQSQVLSPGSSRAKPSKAERKASLRLQRHQQRHSQGGQSQSAICLTTHFERQAQRPRTGREETFLQGPGQAPQPDAAVDVASGHGAQSRNADNAAVTRLPASCIMLVLDTNIYLNERPHVYRMIERWQLLLQAFRPHPAILLIPRAVVKELIAFKQGLKASERPDLASRAASSLQLLTSIEAQPAVHLQGPAERYLPAADSIAKSRYDHEREGDDGILDCMRYFQSLGHDVRLVSQDSAFNVRAAIGNQMIVYNPRQMHELVASLEPQLV